MQNFHFVDQEYNSIEISFLRKSLKKKRLYLIFSTLSLGILPLINFWLKVFNRRLYDDADSISDATHVLLNFKNKQKQKIIQLKYGLIRLLPHYTSKKLYVFNYKKHFYYLSIKSLKVKSMKGRFLEKLKKDKQLLETSKTGICNNSAQEILQIYGDNVIDIKVESILSLLLKLLFSPFTMFQVFSIFIWLLDDYLSFAILIFVMMSGAIGMDIYEIRSEAKKIRELAHHESQVTLYRTPNKTPTNRQEKLNEIIIIKDEKEQKLTEEENLSGSEEPLLSAENEEISTLVRSSIVSSFKVTIGDIIEIRSNEVIPADVLLIEGKCLVDESTLTGETVPVLKTFVDKSGSITETNILSSGTTSLNAFNARGIVIATGYYSKKGELVRSLLLADPIEFRFQKDSLKFVGVTIGVSVLGFIWFVFYIALGKYKQYYSFSKMLIKGLEIFTVAVPPALPLCLAIGNTIANRRLQKQHIYTRVLQKINEAGRVACVCFDKTGTLTMNKLILHGILPVYDAQIENEAKYSEREEDDEAEQYRLFDPLIKTGLLDIYSKHKMSEKSIYRLLIESMGTCHSLTLFEGKVIGDPMEMQLLDECGFNIEERLVLNKINVNSSFETFIKPSQEFISACNYEPDFEYHIIRRLDFSSERKRMSIILEDNKYPIIRIITKGAPEVIKTLCESSSLPFNFDETLEEFTEQGLRVIAVASRRINQNKESIDGDAVDLENKLEFLGFLCFQNPLKEKTAETIKTLKNCKIRCKMITGDNLLTASSVGIATGIIEKHHAIFSVTMKDGEIWWEQLENEDEKRVRHASIFSNDHSGIIFSRKSSESSGDGEALEEQEQSVQIRVIQAHCERKSCSIVMTGEVFDKLFSTNWEKDKFLNMVLDSSVVFARTSPDQKAQIVEKIQNWYKIRSTDNWFVGFCGDGANDCSALKKADVGLSLSENEASIAAPFNTTVHNISSFIPLLREGKASLETAFMNFKYVLYYSFVQFFALLMIYDHAGEFSNGHYYYMDLLVFLPLSIFICGNGTIKELNKHFPKSSLMKVEVLFDIFGHIFIVLFASILLNVIITCYPESLEAENITPNFDIDAEKQFNIEIFGFFIFAAVLNSVGALVFNRGYPFKVDPSKNVALVRFSCLTLFTTILVLFADVIFRDCEFLYVINKIFRELRYDHNIIYLFGTYTFLLSLVCYGFEKSIIPIFRKIVKDKQTGKAKKKGLS